MAEAHNGEPAAAAQQARFVVIEDDVLLADLMSLAIQRRFAPVELRVFAEGRPALEHCRASAPDLVLADLGLPDMDGRQMIRALRDACPQTRIIVLTARVTPTLPAELMALGVSGLLDKASPFDIADTAVRRVLAGGVYYSASFGRSGLNSVHEASTAIAPLTERERDIARMVAAGLISKEIAERLGLSPRTVEKSRARILEKLQLKDLPSLVRWCVRNGLG